MRRSMLFLRCTLGVGRRKVELPVVLARLGVEGSRRLLLVVELAQVLGLAAELGRPVPRKI